MADVPCGVTSPEAVTSDFFDEVTCRSCRDWYQFSLTRPLDGDWEEGGERPAAAPPRPLPRRQWVLFYAAVLALGVLWALQRAAELHGHP